jgi:hypothetical protein
VIGPLNVKFRRAHNVVTVANFSNTFSDPFQFSLLVMETTMNQQISWARNEENFRELRVSQFRTVMGNGTKF